MKNLKNVMAIFTLALIMLVSVNVSAQKTANKTGIDDIIKIVKEGSPTFPNANKYSNNSKEDFNGKEAADLFLTNFSNTLSIVHNTSDKKKVLELNALAKSKLAFPTLDAYVSKNDKAVFAKELNLIIKNSTSQTDFSNKISILSKKKLSDGERQIVYIMTNIVDVLNQHNSTIPSNKVSDCSGWWSCWGQCVAGTLGGALTGAGGLGIAGAAVGTVVPVLGNIALGTLGAIVGGIGGGLTGAAASC